MNQDFVIGFSLVFAAGLFQGSFMLPMTLTRNWRWEHSWALFSLLGMLLFNGALAGSLIPDLIGAYRATPASDLWALVLFGTLWGAGAILFGLGMDKLGMALGYPIIMGLILSLGAIIPLLLQSPAKLVSTAGLLFLAGTTTTIGGIVLCAKAAALKDTPSSEKTAVSGLGAGLVIAVLAGTFSAFPNVGMNYAKDLTEAALKLGAPKTMAGNAAWALLFTAGFVVNFGYCVGLVARRGGFRLWAKDPGRNIGCIAVMAALWIGSFYLYGMGAARMGTWGTIIGWPLFISLAIVVGNLWGLWRGEWHGASPRARSRLTLGLIVLIAAMAVFGAASALD